MRTILIAGLMAMGMLSVLGNHTQASVQRAAALPSAADWETRRLGASLTGNATSPPTIQLARHWGAPRGCYPGAGHHHHIHGRPYGSYHQSYYGPRPWYPAPVYPAPVYPAPVYPAPYGGSSFGLYIGF